jgi:hypothetical protein
MSDRGERLIQALKADPDLMYEVLVALQADKLVGPWQQSDRDQYKRTRRSVDGKLIAVVTKHASRRINPWEASVSREAQSEGERPSKNHMQQGEALAWADMRLIEQGYTLAGVEP